MSSERLEFVLAASGGGWNFSALCRRFGISRDIGYKWLQRYRAEGVAGLEDRSRKPMASPMRTSPALEALVCEVRRRHPAWGARKIYHRLKADGVQEVPSPSTITGILSRRGLLSADRRLKRDWRRFEAEEPNQIWQMDFKGDFTTREGRCYPLTILDDHSRFNLCLAACADQRSPTVKQQLIRTFSEYGLPEIMLVDNGPPWGNGYHWRPHTALTAWLIQLDISVWHGRPYHPQTRGKAERFHRSLKVEVLRPEADWANCVSVQESLTPWRQVYNLDRPHQALGYDVPASRYERSTRELPSTLPPIEYPPNDQLRKVQDNGEISFLGRTITVGRAFTGHPVALRATEEGAWDIYFCKQRIGIADLRSPSSEL